MWTLITVNKEMSCEVFMVGGEGDGEEKKKNTRQSMRLHLVPSLKSKYRSQKSNTIGYQIMLMILMKAAGILFKNVLL